MSAPILSDEQWQLDMAAWSHWDQHHRHRAEERLRNHDAALREKVAVLEAGLHRYGKHDVGCAYKRATCTCDDPRCALKAVPCDCGLTDAIGQP